MIAPLAGFHPSFEALSAHADLSDVDAARSRVGRHVARCAGCHATVEQVRALGVAARAVELPGAPEGLWERIERAGQEDAEATGSPFMSAPAADDRVADRSGRVARRATTALLVAAALVGVLLLPSPFGRSLHAAPERGRWHFAPARPAAGQVVQVRFEAPASLPPLGRLLLLARPVPRWNEATEWRGSEAALVDSIGTLVRAADGVYVGSLTTPADFSALTLELSPPGGGFFPVHRDAAPLNDDAASPAPRTLLVARAADDRPSLDALSSVVALGVGTGGYSVADTLIRYYPAEPVGYAADHRVGGKRLIDDVIAWFHRGERQYARFAERYARQPSVSADHELAMVMLANRIAEPTEARGWVLRVVRDHPEDPRALLVYAEMLYGMFDEPGTLPLIRHALPLADTLWLRNGHRGPSGELAAIAGRAGDTVAVARWAARSWETAAAPWMGRGAFAPALLRDRSLRPAAQRYLERTAHAPCVLPPGTYPLGVSADFWQSQCVGRRRDAYAHLSAMYRLEGEPRLALAFADSAVRLPGFGQGCFYLGPQQRRGEALLAVGDTAAALPELALRAARDRGTSYADSAWGTLRASVDRATWARALAVGRDSLARCQLDWVRRHQADAERLRAAGAPRYYR